MNTTRYNFRDRFSSKSSLELHVFEIRQREPEDGRQATELLELDPRPMAAAEHEGCATGSSDVLDQLLIFATNPRVCRSEQRV